MKKRRLFALMLATLICQPLNADDKPLTNVSRLRLSRPIIRQESDFPTATVRGLVFQQDDRGNLWLYSAGEDKVVRQWQVEFRGDRPAKLRPMEKIRWPIFRYQTGFILALELCPDVNGRKLLAFGGIGLFPSQVSLVDPLAGATASVLKNPKFDRAVERVFSVDCHPREPYLAVGHGGTPGAGDAKVAIWMLDKSPRLVAAIDSGFDIADYVQFSPRGDQLAVVNTATGRVNVWKLTTQPDFTASRASTAQLGSRVNGIAWTGPSTWVAATSESGPRFSSTKPSQVATITNCMGDAIGCKLWQGSEKGWSPFVRIRPRESIEVFDKYVTIVPGETANPNKNALAILDLRGGSIPRPTQWELKRSDGKIRFINVSYATSLAATLPGDRIAFGIYNSDHAQVGANHGQVRLRTLDGRRDVPLEHAEFSGAITAVAFSPDGKYFVAAGRQRSGSELKASNIALRLWSTVSGELLAQFPPQEQFIDEGSPISAVAILSDNRIAFTHGSIQGNVSRLAASPSANATATTMLTLSKLKEFEPVDLGQLPERQRASLQSDQRYRLNWKSQVIPRSFELASVKNNGSIDVNSKLSFPFIAHNGIPLAAVRFSKGSMAFMAVGHESGIFVWNLAKLKKIRAEGGQNPFAAVTRAFIGHEGKVLCLDVADDGSWLLSGSSDGTIRAWNLSDLTVKSTAGRELKVGFKLQDGELRVKSVDPLGPGWAAGFVVGQKVVGIEVAREGLADVEWKVPRERWSEVLDQPVPGWLLVVTVEQNGNRSTLRTAVLHEPLFTVYPLLNRQWVIWSPSGHFYTSSENAAKNLGWHVNLGAQSEKSPIRFFSSDVFWDDYHDEGKIKRLLQYREPIEPTDDLHLPSHVRITRIHSASIAGNESVPTLARPEKLEVTIEAYATGAEKIVNVQLWCNGLLVKEEKDLRDCEIPSKFLRRGQQNTLVAVVESRPPGDSSTSKNHLFGRDLKPIIVAGTPRPKLHYLGIGVTHLEHENAFKREYEIPALKYTANDALALGRTLDRCLSRSGFGRGQFEYVLNRDDLEYTVGAEQITSPTLQNIKAALDRLVDRDRVSADDFVCILLSGHGFDERNVEDEHNTEDERRIERGFFFVAQDTQDDLNNTLTRKEIYTQLQKLPCATLLLIDACRAGSIGSNRHLRYRGEMTIGPEILVSCKPRQTSFEEADLRFEFVDRRWVGRGHGLFTAAMIEALSSQRLDSGQKQRPMRPLSTDALDFDRDGTLNVEELNSYVRKRIPQLFRTLYPNEDATQNPDFLPSITFPARQIKLRVF